AKIAVPACDALTGRLKARKTRTKRFRATRSMCGDGILDPSGGEACEISAPHGDYACPGACQPSGSVGACGCPSVTPTTSSTISTTTSSNPTTTTSEPSSSTTSTTTTTTESSSTTTTTASTLPPTTTSSTTSSTITSSTIE